MREPTGTWKKLGEYMKQVYPIGPADFSWNMEPDVDASAAEYDLLTEDGMYQLWDDLRG